MITKKGIFVFQMFAAIVGVIIIFLGFGALDIFDFSFQMQLLLCALVLVQFTVGIIIMTPVIDVKNEYLAIRFLVITALQIFSFLAMCLVFTFTGISNGKDLMLWYLGLFLLLMIFQSIITVKAIKS
jgi:hypothetical protein